MSNLASKEPAAPSEKPVSLKVAEEEACFKHGAATNVNNVLCFDNVSTTEACPILLQRSLQHLRKSLLVA